MKRMILFSLMALMTIAAFGRKHVENATVVADTIFYAENMSNVTSADQASYYRLLMTTGSGLNKKDVFQDFYMNGNLRAEGGYSFIDLGNDRNTIFNGEVTTYYKNGKEKWHGNYVNGKREGYFIPHPGTSRNIHIRQILCYLRRVDIYLLRNLCRRYKLLPLISHQFST